MDVLHHLIDLTREILSAVDLDRVGEAMEKCQPFKKLNDVALEGRTQLRIHLLCQLRLLLDLLKVRNEFTEGEIFSRVRLPAERSEGFRIADDKDLPVLRDALFHQDLGEPVDRRQS